MSVTQYLVSTSNMSVCARLVDEEDTTIELGDDGGLLGAYYTTAHMYDSERRARNEGKPMLVGEISSL